MTSTPAVAIWPALRCKDTKGLIKFLGDAFGFEESVVVEEEGGAVAHAQIKWPQGGGVMLGDATDSDDGLHAQLPRGPVSIYVVCDDPDTLFQRATAAGAEVLQGLKDEEYGSRGFTVKDPEGNVWSFGTYRGE